MSLFRDGLRAAISRASLIFLLEVLDSVANTSTLSHEMVWPVVLQCSPTAVKDERLILVCSLTLFWSARAVSPTYFSSQSLQSM